jgi:hypothetical protein
MKKFLHKIFVDIKIIIIAMIIVIAMVIITKNPNLFTASVLSIQDQKIMIENSWDVWYKTTWNIFDVFLSDNIDWFDSIDFSISFDQENIILDIWNISSQLTYNIVSNYSWEINMTLFANTGVDYSQSLFTIPFSWSNPLILLWEVVVKSISKWDNTLAIWNIDEAKTNH